MSHPTAPIESQRIAPVSHSDIYAGSVVAEKLRPTAEIPYPGEANIGSIVSLCERCDGRPEDNELDVNTFATGLRFTVPQGFYAVARGVPELGKRGYWVVGGELLILPDCEEELVVPLYKFKSGEDLVLPFGALMVTIHKQGTEKIVHLAAPKQPTYRPGMAGMMNGGFSSEMTLEYGGVDASSSSADPTRKKKSKKVKNPYIF